MFIFNIFYNHEGSEWHVLVAHTHMESFLKHHSFCCSISIFKEPSRYAVTPWSVESQLSWRNCSRALKWSWILMQSWNALGKNGGALRVKDGTRVKGMDLFPGTRHLLSGLTNSSKGWVAYPQIAWLGNLSMLKIQNGWEFRFVSRWGSKSSIWKWCHTLVKLFSEVMSICHFLRKTSLKNSWWTWTPSRTFTSRK